MKLNIQLFANGTITGTSTASVGRVQIVWSSVAGDSVSNKSSVTATVQVKRSNAYETTGTFSGTVTINGSSKSISKKFSPLSNSWKTIDSYTIDVPHESDGTKICTISTSFKNTGTSMAGTYTASANVTLDTILRESTPTVSASSVEMGNSVTIYTNRKSNSFTHNIRYSFGSLSNQTSGLTYYNNVNTDTPFIPPISLAQQIPSATSGSATISCETFSGGTSIGIKTVGITLTVPSSVKPTISIGTITEANATMASLNWGVFVQNKSQLSIPITASGSQGSWITGTTTSVAGSSYSGTSITTGIINASGSVGISSTTTDSRSRTASTSSSATFVAYSNPQITTATAVRCLSDGTEDDEGTYLKYSFVGSISPVSNHNGHLFRIGYRQKGIGNYTYTNVDTANYSINKSNIVLNLNLDTSKSYDIRFEANDTFTSTPIERTIDTGFDLMNFNPSGKAMAIGKVSEAGANEEKLEIGIDTEIYGILNTHRLEMWPDGISTTPYIDFHHNGSTADYTSRIIEKNAGELTFSNDVIFESNIKKHITINNESGRTGSNIILRGTSGSPEASINVGNISNGAKSYIFGYNVGSTDSFGIYSVEASQSIMTINKNGNMWVRGYIQSNNGVRVYKSMTFADFVCNLSNTDLGVDDCTKYMWSFQPSNWENYFFVNSATTTSIIIRGWRISGTSSATITLINNASYGAIVLGVRIG